MLILSPEQKEFLSKLGYFDLSDIFPNIEKTIETYCQEKEIEFPIYTLQKNNAYFEFLKGIVNPSSDIYEKELHEGLIDLIELRDKYKKEVIELFNFSEVA